MTIIGAVNSAPLFKLKKSWVKVKKKSITKSESFKLLFSSDRVFQNLRKATEEKKAAQYLALFLMDLNFVMDGNANERDGKINFRKAVLLSSC